MKILIITAGYFPGKKYGGPPVSVKNFCDLMTEYECFIVTKNHDMGEKNPYKDIKNGWNKNKNVSVLYLNDNEYNYRYFEKVIKEIKPDVLYLQSLFQSCVMPCLKLAKKYSLKVLLAPRGELCSGAFKKKYKKIPYIMLLRIIGLLKNTTFQSTCDDETDNIKKYLKVDKNNIYYLSNIPTIPVGSLKARKKMKGTANLIFLSRIVPKKNLLFALECLEKINGKIVFDIYGPKEDLIYWKKCEEKIKTLSSNVSVNYCGLLNHEEVCDAFSNYDAFLFPTLSENFGHVIAESLSVGTPVIISNQTPWKNLFKYNAGWEIDLKDANKFSKCVQCIVDMDNNEYIKFQQGAKNKFKEFIKLNELKTDYFNCFEKIMRS